jgi:hypothetical protein
MTISLHKHFVTQVQARPAEVRAEIFDAILELPDAFRNPGKHTGLGLRKLHRSGIWEIRVGLELRALLQLASDTVILRFLGTHDQVRHYLRNL